MTGLEVTQPNKRLTAERLEKLERIRFCWSAKHVRKNGITKLTEFNGNGNGNVSDSSQGAAHATTAADSASSNKSLKRAAMDDLGGGRAAARLRLAETQWEEMYDRLTHYKNINGDCLVPRKYEHDPKLASWVETQRVLWNKDYRQFSLQEEAGEGYVEKPCPGEAYPACAVLDPLDVHNEQLVTALPPASTTATSTTGWQGATPEDAAEVAATMALEAPTAVSTTTVPAISLEGGGAVDADAEGAAIVPFIKRLTPERKEKLDSLGFVWSLRSKRIEDHWDEMFRQLVEYKTGHGDCLVPSRYEENLKLGKVCSCSHKDGTSYYSWFLVFDEMRHSQLSFFVYYNMPSGSKRNATNLPNCNVPPTRHFKRI
jgi:hypothetical protein